MLGKPNYDRFSYEEFNIWPHDIEVVEGNVIVVPGERDRRVRINTRREAVVAMRSYNVHESRVVPMVICFTSWCTEGLIISKIINLKMLWTTHVP